MSYLPPGVISTHVSVAACQVCPPSVHVQTTVMMALNESCASAPHQCTLYRISSDWIGNATQLWCVWLRDSWSYYQLELAEPAQGKESQLTVQTHADGWGPYIGAQRISAESHRAEIQTRTKINVKPSICLSFPKKARGGYTQGHETASLGPMRQRAGLC